MALAIFCAEAHEGELAPFRIRQTWDKDTPDLRAMSSLVGKFIYFLMCDCAIYSLNDGPLVPP